MDTLRLSYDLATQSTIVSFNVPDGCPAATKVLNMLISCGRHSDFGGVRCPQTHSNLRLVAALVDSIILESELDDNAAT